MTSSAAIETLIEGRTHDLGEFEVRRMLPGGRRRRMVGCFIFLDHFGPSEFAPGAGISVRPHPHIGLATVTYLFAGEIVHRDSVGCVQTIRPGDVNWMTAGRGIVHSERSDPALLRIGASLHGVQSWVALPREHEAAAPAFHHHPAATLPAFECDGVALRVIAGTAYGAISPVAVFSPTLYVDAVMPAGSTLPVDMEHEERAIYPVEGEVRVAGVRLRPGSMAGAGARLRSIRAGAVRGARDAARWRRHRGRTPHLVELRLQQPGAHRAGQGRLARGPLRRRSR